MEMSSLGVEGHYGWPMAVFAAQHGTTAIGIVSDMDHHKNPMMQAMMKVSGNPFNINGVPIVIMRAPMVEVDFSGHTERVKDWFKAIEYMEHSLYAQLLPRK